MIPSSAAMLRNLQQNPMSAPSFSMENLLQSTKSSSAANKSDLNLTLNCWASFMAYQRADIDRNQQRRLEREKQKPDLDDMSVYPEIGSPAKDSIMSDVDSGAESIPEAVLEQPTKSPGPKQQDDKEPVAMDTSRISEETCSCGEEQCTGGTACRRIQEKEKPVLKFSVNAILGDSYDRRPNPGIFSFTFSFLLES